MYRIQMKLCCNSVSSSSSSSSSLIVFVCLFGLNYASLSVISVKWC